MQFSPFSLRPKDHKISVPKKSCLTALIIALEVLLSNSTCKSLRAYLVIAAQLIYVVKFDLSAQRALSILAVMFDNIED